ncbi:putative alpha-amylase [Rosa chinensis]|uniref:Putative alpha-amylase n=1 Tax=Rosa chinensis TaxID=74649 RepID=A0A2P6RHG9_ROSCH|nr:putative alpha-amylase [Rosa chinensis]
MTLLGLSLSLSHTHTHTTAFDFTTKGVLQEAVKGQLWSLRDPQGKPPGVMH